MLTSVVRHDGDHKEECIDIQMRLLMGNIFSDTESLSCIPEALPMPGGHMSNLMNIGRKDMT